MLPRALHAVDSNSAPATLLRVAISDMVHHLAADLDGAQLLFSANLGTPVLRQCRERTLQRFADVLVALAEPQLREGVDPGEPRMSTLMGVGGFVELVTAWQAGSLETDGERLIDHAARVTTLLADQHLVPHRDAVARMAWSALVAINTPHGGPPGSHDPAVPAGQSPGTEQR